MSFFSKAFVLISAILMIFIGVYCFMHPIIALSSVAWALGFFILISGITGIISYITMPKQHHILWGVIICIIDILFGIFALTSVGSVALAFVLAMMFAVLLIIRGVFSLIYSREVMGGLIKQMWFFRIMCILQIILGIFLLASPAVAAAVLSYVIGFGLLFAGFAKVSLWNDIRSL